MNSINILFEDFLQTSRLDTLEEIKKSSEISKLYDKISEDLSAQQLDLFNEFTNLVDEINLNFTKKAFYSGIKCGVEICSLKEE